MIITTATTALRAEAYRSPKIRSLFQTALLSTSALAVAIAPTSAQADTTIKGNKTVVVDGSGNGTSGNKNSPWNVSGNLKVGGSGLFDGSGTLTVRNGGVVNIENTLKVNPGSINSGTVNIGAGLGQTAQGAGTINVDKLKLSSPLGFASLVFNHTDSDYVFAPNIEGNGSVSVLSGSTTLTGTNTYSGLTTIDGGTLIVSGGGSLSNTYFITVGVASGSGSKLVIDGSNGGGSLSSVERVTIGATNRGSLDILAGGNVDVDDVRIGSLASGKALVSGANSKLIADSLIVGDFANGTLTVADGGLVSVDGSIKVGHESGGSGTIIIGAAAGETAVGAGTIQADSLKFGNSGGNGGDVVFNHTGTDYTFAPAILGSASVQHYAGNTTLTGASDYSGNTVVHGGTLTIGDGGTVTGNVDVIIGQLADDVGKLVVDAENGGGTLSASNNISVGYNGNGTLDILNGGSASATSIILGEQANSVGTVTVSGTDSELTATSYIEIGSTGSGTLNILDGGAVSNTDGLIGNISGSTGKVTVSGSGSTWTNSGKITVGEAGVGTLEVLDGGAVTSAYGYIGASSGSTGSSATISGEESSWEITNELQVGRSANGTLSVLDGGYLSNVGTQIGVNSDGTGEATVSGAGSRWEANGEFVVGFTGSGTVNVLDGGTLSTENGNVGVFASGDNSVTVSDAGSSWVNSGTLVLGGQFKVPEGESLPEDGSNALSVLNGGSVSNVDAIIGASSGALSNDVLVSGEGSTWTNTGFITIADVGNGTLTVADGGHVSVGGAFTVANQAGAVGSVIIGAAADEEAVGAGTIEVDALAFGEGDATLLFNHTDNDYVFAPSISGLGVVRHYAGTTTLSATNTYTGVTYVHGGTLQISNGGSLSGSNLSIGSDYDDNGSFVVSGANGGGTLTADLAEIGDEGEGALSVLDGGTATLGDVRLGIRSSGSGTLMVSGAESILDVAGLFDIGLYGSGTVNVLEGGTLNTVTGDLGQNGVGSNSVTVSGAGSSWVNSGTLTLGRQVKNPATIQETDGGSNALSVLDGGSVSNVDAIIGSGSGALANDVLVSGEGSLWTNTGFVTIGDTDAGTLTVADGGMVVVDGVFTLAGQEGSIGTINIGAAAGEEPVAAGTIDTDALVFGEGDATLLFNHTDSDYVFDLDISGDGSIQQLSGTTTLTGDNSGFLGLTEVELGHLVVNSALGGTVSVGEGGILSGTGTVGTMTLSSGGTIAPGNSIGTLTVDGDFASATGSIYEVEVDPAGESSDLIAVTGKARLNGGTVHHVGLTGEYLPYSTYTILTAEGGVLGHFDGAVTDYAFLEGILDYTDYSVTLTMLRNDIDFSEVAITRNQLSVAAALQSLEYGDALFNDIVLMSEDGARAAYDSLSGEIHGAMQTVAIEDSKLVRDALLGHMRRSEGSSLWGEAFGNWGESDGPAGTAKVDRDTVGFLAGADFGIAKDATVGIAFGYTDTDARQDQRYSTGTAEALHILAYAAYQTGGVKLRAGLGFASNDINTQRSVVLDDISEQMSASYNSDTVMGFGELGYTIALDGGSIEPFVGLSAIEVDTDAFTESAGVSSLSSADASLSSTQSTVGAHFDFGMSSAFQLEGTAAWVHAFDGYTSSSQLSLPGTPSFEVVSVGQSRDAALLELGAAIEASKGVSLNLGYRGMIGDNSEDHGVMGGIAIRF